MLNLGANSQSAYFKEIAAGYIFGTVGWCVGINIGYAAFKKKEGLIVPICGYTLYGLSSSVGVWIVGKEYSGGKYLPTLCWTAGLPLAIIGVSMACGIQLSTANALVWVSLPIGSFIGYNLSTKKKKKQ